MDKNFTVTLTHVLGATLVLAALLALTQGYQTSLLMRDRELLRQAMNQQEQPFTQAQRLEQQLRGLVTGVQQLSANGNQNVSAVIDRLRELNVIQAPQPAAAATNSAFPAPVPAAREMTERGPVKP